MKKHYTAPDAQMVLFAPCERITTAWTQKDDWKLGGLFWKQDSDINIPETGPSGTHYWYNFGTDEIK